jgi:hypothetical protein
VIKPRPNTKLSHFLARVAIGPTADLSVSLSDRVEFIRLANGDLDVAKWVFLVRVLALGIEQNGYAGSIQLVKQLASLASGTVLRIIFRRCWPVSEEASRSFSPGVSMEPGLTAFTRIRRSF